jgi:putative transposase
VIDEYTREALATDVELSIDADGVVAVSSVWRPSAAPRPTFAPTTSPSSSPMPWPTVAASTARARCSSTCRPWPNAGIESFNGRLRDELLNGQQFDSLIEARVLIEDWRIDYNMDRPPPGWLIRSSSSRPGVTNKHTNSHNGWLNYRGPVTMTSSLILYPICVSGREVGLGSGPLAHDVCHRDAVVARVRVETTSY